MVLWDVNLLVYACSPRTTHHDACQGMLQRLVDGAAPFAVSPQILAAVVRVTTNPKVFDPPASPGTALAFCDALRTHPRAVSIAPGPRHWAIFADLVLATGVRGSDTTDAYLAALAMEHGCEWWSADRGFGRFSGLRWNNPLAP